jgi:hypothetical protein
VSAILQIAGYSADALAAGHDDPLTLLPGNQVVSGYADELISTRDPEKWLGMQNRLSTAAIAFTHMVSIRRALLTAAVVDIKAVSGIQTVDGRTYRVRDFMDSPADPCVAFFCTMA